MKNLVHLSLAAALSMPATAVLAQAGMKGMDMGGKPSAGAPATHKASGTVTTIR